MSRYKLSIVITCIFGIVIIIGGYFATEYIQKRIDQNLVDNYAIQEVALARNISKSLETEIVGIKNQLIIMSQHPNINSGNAAECLSEIKKDLATTSSKLGNVGRVGIDGLFHCSLNPALVGVKAANIGPYISDIFNDPEHNPVMSRAVKAPGAPGYLAALHVPVWNKEGKFDGTLGGAIYLIDLQKKYLEDVKVASQGYVVLLDDDNTLLYHVRPELIGTKATSTEFLALTADAKKGNEGIGKYTSASQGLKIAGYAPVNVLPGRTWVVVVTVPIADIDKDLGNIGVDVLLTRAWILIALIVVGAEIGLIYISQKFVFKPLKEIQEMKSDFVSLVSHQLKTPVAQIKGYVENMLEGLTGPINEKQREYMNDMLHVANKNSKLIDDLLNVSRIERRMLKVELVPLNLNEILEDVLGPLREVAKKKGVELTETPLTQPVTVIADEVKIREALRNIVDNAIKFTNAGKKVSIQAKAEATKAIVTVTDEGTGIEPHVEKELFEKNRVWSGKVQASGAGLGLFLSKQFIVLMGGTITFVTAAGKGTTFTITLPKK